MNCAWRKSFTKLPFHCFLSYFLLLVYLLWLLLLDIASLFTHTSCPRLNRNVVSEALSEPCLHRYGRLFSESHKTSVWCRCPIAPDGCSPYDGLLSWERERRGDLGASEHLIVSHFPFSSDAHNSQTDWLTFHFTPSYWLSIPLRGSTDWLFCIL